MPDHPFFHGARPTLHIAHRGGARLAPENTLVAFAESVERFRTDMLELDIRASSDGELVVFHDETLGRCTDGEGPVAARSLEELRSLDAAFRFTTDGGRHFPWRGAGVRIPTLREVLRAWPALRLNIELKSDRAGAAEAFVEMLREERAVDRCCIGSEQDAIGERLVALLPGGCHFYPAQRLAEVVLALKRGSPLQQDDPFLVLDMPLYHEGTRLVDAAFVRAAAAHDRWINVWTVDDESEMRQLVADGVGGVMTDRPDLLRRVLDDRQA